MHTPEVAVITAAYNAAGVIERNIRSVGTQSLKPSAHIIIDDGSTDETVSVVHGLQDEFPHVRIIRQANGGAGVARNAGIAMAATRYIAFLDSDDYWTEGKLEAQIGFMIGNNVPFSYGDYCDVDGETGTILGRHEAPESVSYTDLLRGCPIGCLTVAFDQTVLGKRFMPAVRRGHDWGHWLALTRDGTVARRYPGCHAYYHRSKNSLSSGKLGKVADVFRIYRRHERVSALRSLMYMFPHVISALTKRPMLED